MDGCEKEWAWPPNFVGLEIRMLNLISFLGFSIAFTLITFLLWRSQKKISALNEKNLELEKENLVLRSQITNAEDNLIRDRDLFKSFQGELENHFRGLAAQALEGNNKQFLELAQSTLAKKNQEAENLLTRKEDSIQNIIKPLSIALQELSLKTAEIEKDRTSMFASIDSEIKRVITTNQILAKETMALKDALKKPHVRGRWGEVQLKNCIELAGMSEYSDVSFQSSVSDDDNQRLIPDMTVRMPGGRVVVVDAKTPLDAFITALETQDETERALEIARHGRHVKDHVKKLSAKDYASAIKGSADFTVMFLPNESFLYSALEAEPQLMEYALEKRILIATPPTLIGLLKVISYGWNEEKLAESAAKISETGIELHKRVCDFVETYQSVGKHIGKALSEYESGWSRLSSRVIVQAKKLEKLGAKSKKDLPNIAESSLSDMGETPDESPTLEVEPTLT